MAPLALVGAVVAVLLVANSHTGKSSSGSGGSAATTSSTASTPTHTTATHHHGRFYVVKAGDVLSAIAGKTGVPLAEIERLNPNVDAQSLTVGQKLKLAP